MLIAIRSSAVCISIAHPIVILLTLVFISSFQLAHSDSREKSVLVYHRQTATCHVSHTYHSSPLETFWRANVETLVRETTAEWKRGCTFIKTQKEAINIYMAYWKEREHWTQLEDKGYSRSLPSGNMNGKFDHNIFSYFEVVHKCGREKYSTHVPIEPLMGALRHPLFFCKKQKANSYRANKNYMLPLFNHERFPRTMSYVPVGQNFLFDLGASLYSKGPGGASQEWFVNTYAQRGLKFDRILAWEIENHDAAEIFRQYPSHVFGKVSYYNIAAAPDPNASGNPIRLLKTLTRPEDFVVIKIDIDNGQNEMIFIEQILNDEEAASHVDELYFEHHVTDHPLYWKAWSAHETSMNLSQSYDLFTRLREMGIRAHSWV